MLKKSMIVVTPLASLALLLAVAGCPGGPPAPDNDNDGGQNGVTFRGDVEPILTSICGTCHQQGGTADDRGIPLRLDGSDDFDGLLNDSSMQDNSLKFVVAGEPDQSLVYLKVSQDPPPVGERMPQAPTPPLTEAQQQIIRDWIAAGASLE